MSVDQDTVTLVTNGREFGGWKAVRIEAGIERQARSFTLDVTDRWPGSSDVRRINPGDTVQIYIGQDRVCTGYVDGTPVSYDGKQLTLGVKGRSKTADLVDCCPPPSGATGGGGGKWGDVVGPDGKSSRQKGSQVASTESGRNQFKNQKLETIAASMASFYGVKVYAEVDTGAVIPDHTIQQGETVFESIDRMMRLRHVLSTDNAAGDLVFIDPGSGGDAYSALELGKNILSSSAELDYKDVFSKYICKGQRAGSDNESGEAVSEESASLTDDILGRTRILVLKQSGQADEGNCRDRIEYERGHRLAKAVETRYTVAGWRQSNGALWVPNQRVMVIDPLVGFNHVRLLVAEVSWILDANGQRCEIRVGPVEGYRTKAAKSAKKKGGKKQWGDVETEE